MGIRIGQPCWECGEWLTFARPSRCCIHAHYHESGIRSPWGPFPWEVCRRTLLQASPRLLKVKGIGVETGARSHAWDYFNMLQRWSSMEHWRTCWQAEAKEEPSNCKWCRRLPDMLGRECHSSQCRVAIRTSIVNSQQYFIVTCT